MGSGSRAGSAFTIGSKVLAVELSGRVQLTRRGRDRRIAATEPAPRRDLVFRLLRRATRPAGRDDDGLSLRSGIASIGVVSSAQ